jgi:hypothetical protein
MTQDEVDYMNMNGGCGQTMMFLIIIAAMIASVL